MVAKHRHSISCTLALALKSGAAFSVRVGKKQTVLGNHVLCDLLGTKLIAKCSIK